jgi:DivIVA domain-containing protein
VLEYNPYRGERMDKFNSALRGYDKTEVNDFIDNIINRVEIMVNEISDKEEQIEKYKSRISDLEKLVSELEKTVERFEEKESATREFVLDDTLERSKIESKKIMDDAKLKARNIVEKAEEQADVIMKECLMEASRHEIRLNNLKDEIDKLKQKKETVYYE